MADYRHYIRRFGAELSIRDFVDVVWRRSTGARVPIHKAMEATFAQPASDDERRMKTLIDEFKAEETTRLEQKLFGPGPSLRVSTGQSHAHTLRSQ